MFINNKIGFILNITVYLKVTYFANNYQIGTLFECHKII